MSARFSDGIEMLLWHNDLCLAWGHVALLLSPPLLLQELFFRSEFGFKYHNSIIIFLPKHATLIHLPFYGNICTEHPFLVHSEIYFCEDYDFCVHTPGFLCFWLTLLFCLSCLHWCPSICLVWCCCYHFPWCLCCPSTFNAFFLTLAPFHSSLSLCLHFYFFLLTFSSIVLTDSWLCSKLR